MQFLSFPIEVRLGIYSELLVQQSPIEFRADRGPCSPRLTRTGKQGLNPGLLRVNKTVNREATPHLYSNNRFRFPDAHVSIDRYLEGPYIAPFLRQIGTNAGLLRHICINFPTSFAPPHSGKPVLYREHIQLFQLIQETCTGLKIVEISCMPPDRIFSVDDVDLAAEMLETLDNSGFHAMPSLETIVVVLGEYTIDEEVLACRDALMQRMPSCKWFVELIKVPPRVCISANDMIEFDNPEDCRRYDEEMYRGKWSKGRGRSGMKNIGVGGMIHIGKIIQTTISLAK